MQIRSSGKVYAGHISTTPLDRPPKRPRRPMAAGRPRARRRTDGESAPSPQPIAADSDSAASSCISVDRALPPLAEQPRDEPGITVIGRSVRKEFNAGWFDGTVTQFDAQTCLYKVVYSDKDSEVMAFSELSDIIADDRYIGCAVRKEFNDGWFNGTVTSFDPDSSNYEISYSDGDSENVSLALLSAIIVGNSARPGDLEDMVMDEPGSSTETVDVHPEELGDAHSSGPPPAAPSVVTRQDAPHVPEQAEQPVNSICSSLAFDCASLSPDEDALPVQGPVVAGRDVRVPDSVHSLHAALLRQFKNDTSGLPMPIHETYQLSGVMIEYAVPPYMKPTTRTAMLDWMETQNTEDEFANIHALNDNNCTLNFAEFVLWFQIPHREYRHLRELITKWLPADVTFPPMGDEEPHGRDHQGAYLLRLGMTRKGLEEYLDRRIAAHRQACHIPPYM